MIAEDFETWLELASAEQFEGQGDQYTAAPVALPDLRGPDAHHRVYHVQC